jgi:hypothetical protein
VQIARQRTDDLRIIEGGTNKGGAIRLTRPGETGPNILCAFFEREV